MLEGPARERRLDALVVLTDVYAWKLLRRDMARSVTEAGTILKGLIRAMLAGDANFNLSGDER